MNFLIWPLALFLFVLICFFSIHNAFPITVDLWPWHYTMTAPLCLILGAVFALGLLLGGLVVSAGNFFRGKKKFKKSSLGGGIY